MDNNYINFNNINNMVEYFGFIDKYNKNIKKPTNIFNKLNSNGKTWFFRFLIYTRNIDCIEKILKNNKFIVTIENGKYIIDAVLWESYDILKLLLKHNTFSLYTKNNSKVYNGYYYYWGHVMGAVTIVDNVQIAKILLDTKKIYNKNYKYKKFKASKKYKDFKYNICYQNNNEINNFIKLLQNGSKKLFEYYTKNYGNLIDGYINNNIKSVIFNGIIYSSQFMFEYCKKRQIQLFNDYDIIFELFYDFKNCKNLLTKYISILFEYDVFKDIDKKNFETLYNINIYYITNKQFIIEENENIHKKMNELLCSCGDAFSKNHKIYMDNLLKLYKLNNY